MSRFEGIRPGIHSWPGFTEAARQKGERLGVFLVDLAPMDGDFALMAAG